MTCNPIYNRCMMQFYNPAPILNARLAHAYVPFQYIHDVNCIYPPMKGLQQGTIFPELDRPYGADPEYTIDA